MIPPDDGRPSRPSRPDADGPEPPDPTVYAPSELATEAPPGRSGDSAGRSGPRSGSGIRESPFPRIAGYRILQRLGHGGMGEVFEAEQLEPVRRRVAVKVIRAGRGGPEVVARFGAERQALALMDHSSIAKAYDAGLAENGSPWLAMELVRGLPIHKYCDGERLPIRERLELFLKVCAAVQHAHQKGIIHRDLKPSNVLVKTEDDRPVPKIIDFGVAKAISMPLTDAALETSLGQVIGTPEFMSPEQAGRGELDVDTRTDVYALGVILYVLLTGVLPFSSEELRSAGPDEMRRRIREDDPPLPSTRVSEDRSGAEKAAARRRLAAGELSRRLRGDLDWIVARALEKDRARRYESVGALADDVRAHLAHEPIRAARPGLGYRLRKSVRRHPLATVVAGATLTLVLSTAAILAAAATRLAAERDRANLEARSAEEVAGFLVDLFRDAGPERASERELTVREVLDDGASQLERRLTDQPAVRARLMDAIGDVYLTLGRAAEGGPLVEEAAAIRRELFGSRHPETARSLATLARLRKVEGRVQDEEALARESLAIREAALGPDHPDTAESLRLLGWALMKQDRYPEAADAFERALEIRRNALDPLDPALAESLFDLGTLSWHQGDYERAEDLLRQMIERIEGALGPDHVRLTRGLDALGALSWTLGRHDDADRFYRRSVEILERTSGPSSGQLANDLINLGLLAAERGRPDQAVEELERALRLCEEIGGREHPRTARAMGNLAWALHRAGEADRALPLFEEALVLSEKTLGPTHRQVASQAADLAALLVDLGDLDAARRHLERSRSIVAETFGEDHLRMADVLVKLGALHRAEGNPDGARAALVRAEEIRARNLGPDDPAVEEVRTRLDELGPAS